MTTNEQFEIDNLNQQIDELLESDSALAEALAGDNPLLYLAASISNESQLVPTAAQKAQIFEKLNAAQIMPTPPALELNYLAWAVGIALLLVLFIVAAIGFAETSSTQDDASTMLTESLDELESTEETIFALEATEESTETINRPEATENAASATASPESTAEIETTIESTEEILSVVAPNKTASQSTSLFVNSGGPVNVRTGPNTSFSIITTITPNTEVTVIGSKDAADWLNVILPDGTEGWIASSLLSEERGADGSPINPGTNGRDNIEDCERGNSCNVPGQTGENRGNANGRGQGNGG